MNKGFTATELIVVLVVLGLLATLSLSRYYAYLAKGRQAEATVNLTTIGTLQETWKFGHGSYNSGPGDGGVGEFGAGANDDKCRTDLTDKQMTNKLGFRPKDCEKLRYGYNWTTSEAIATSSAVDENKYVYPGCAEFDKWELKYSSLTLENIDKVIEKCKD